MFKLDRSTMQYIRDLSDPDVVSQSDPESINLKREIIRDNVLTLFIGTFVISSIIILFIFYLPGLFNVFIQIIFYYLASVLTYWKILIVAFIFFLVLLFFSFRHT
ncbi:MAG: hypothetical protein M3Q44_02675 [bacterium]|nr:hypothetical protein [bacterium]